MLHQRIVWFVFGSSPIGFTSLFLERHGFLLLLLLVLVVLVTFDPELDLSLTLPQLAGPDGLSPGSQDPPEGVHLAEVLVDVLSGGPHQPEGDLLGGRDGLGLGDPLAGVLVGESLVLGDTLQSPALHHVPLNTGLCPTFFVRDLTPVCRN